MTPGRDVEGGREREKRVGKNKRRRDRMGQWREIQMYRSNYPLDEEGAEIEPVDAPLARNSPLFLSDTTRLLPRIPSHPIPPHPHPKPTIFSLGSPYFSR